MGTPGLKPGVSIFRQGEIECSTPSRFTLRPYSSPMPVDDPFDRRESYTRTFIFGFFVKTRKRLEDSARFRQIKTAPIIADKDNESLFTLI